MIKLLYKYRKLIFIVIIMNILFILVFNLFNKQENMKSIKRSLIVNEINPKRTKYSGNDAVHIAEKMFNRKKIDIFSVESKLISDNFGIVKNVVKEPMWKIKVRNQILLNNKIKKFYVLVNSNTNIVYGIFSSLPKTQNRVQFNKYYIHKIWQKFNCPEKEPAISFYDALNIANNRFGNDINNAKNIYGYYSKMTFIMDKSKGYTYCWIIILSDMNMIKDSYTPNNRKVVVTDEMFIVNCESKEIIESSTYANLN